MGYEYLNMNMNIYTTHFYNLWFFPENLYDLDLYTLSIFLKKKKRNPIYKVSVNINLSVCFNWIKICLKIKSIYYNGYGMLLVP